MTSQIRPLGDRILVEPLPSEDVTPGGIVIPEVARDRPSEGRVLAVGPEASLLEFGGRGARVVFSKYAGTELTGDDGTQVLVLRADEVIAIREEA